MKFPKNLILLLIGIFLAFTFSLKADTYQLFTANGKNERSLPHKNYRKIILSLKQGDKVVFSDGTQFTIEKFLNHGNTTMIFEIADGRAIRLPLSYPFSWRTRHCRDWLEKWFRGHHNLKNLGLSLPGLHSSAALSSEVLVVDKIEEVFTLSAIRNRSARYLEYIERHGEEKVLGALKKLINELKSVDQILDFNLSQFLFDGEKFYMVDFGDEIVLKSNRWKMYSKTQNTLIEVLIDYLAQRKTSGFKNCYDFARIMFKY